MGGGHRGRPRSEYIQRTSAGTRRPRSQVIKPSPNVFINYIPPHYTEADLRQLCAPYGEIVSSKIMINLDTGQSKCFGFVKMRDINQATAVIHGIDGIDTLIDDLNEIPEDSSPTLLFFSTAILSILIGDPNETPPGSE